MSKQYVPLYLLYPRMTEGQIHEALSVSETMPLFRAVIQILDDARTERLTNANAFVAENNTDGMIGSLGGWDVLNSVISDLESRRQKANKN